MKKEILRIENGIKMYNGREALNDVSIQVFSKEICGLIIENTREKECFISVLSGEADLDYGWVYVKEEKLSMFNEDNVLSKTVFFVDNQNKLADNLSLEDNIFVIRKRKKLQISKKNLCKPAEELFDSLNLTVNPKELAGHVGILEKKKAEIVKAYVNDYQLIVLVGIGSMLSDTNLVDFFQFLSWFQDRGIGFLLIENNEDLLINYTDSLYLFSKGKTKACIKRKDYNKRKLYSLLLGDSFSANQQRKIKIEYKKEGAPLLEIKNLSTIFCENMSFTIREGELVNLLDLDSANYKGIVEVLKGDDPILGGEIFLGGKPYRPRGTYDAVKKGVGFLDENAMHQLLFYEMGVLDDLCRVMAKKVYGMMWTPKYRNGIANEIREDFTKEEMIQPLIKVDSLIRQKLVYFRWLLCPPKLLICVRPFSTIDFHLRRVTEELIERILKKGTAVLIVTANMSEACFVGERVVVIKDKKVFEDDSRNIVN